MALSNFNTRIMEVVRNTHHQGEIRYGISRGNNAHLCHLCQFVGHYLCLQAIRTPLIYTAYYKNGIFCLNHSIITDV